MDKHHLKYMLNKLYLIQNKWDKLNCIINTLQMINLNHNILCYMGMFVIIESL